MMHAAHDLRLYNTNGFAVMYTTYDTQQYGYSFEYTGI